jgi:hypothetical protein
MSSVSLTAGINANKEEHHMNRTDTMKVYELNAGIAIIAAIDKAIAGCPELLEKGAREKAIGAVEDLISDLFYGCVANAELADFEAKGV